MPLVDIATPAPIQRLRQVAASDTGQSRAVAAFPLAWWNAKSCGGFDLTDLWSVDDAIARDMLATGLHRNDAAGIPDRLRSRARVRATGRLVAPALIGTNDD